MRDAEERNGPLVLNIRMSGRLVPFATMLMLFALLPFLGGSTPQTPRASVLLAAGSPAVQDAVDAVGDARNVLSESTVNGAQPAAAPALSAFSSAIGGGLFMFPAISLAPATAEAIAAPLVHRPLFIHPVPGGETSGFGPRVHPVLGRPMFHTGIDLAASCGTPIRAAAAGTVIYARVSNSWGGRTIIQHSPTLKTAYGHQSKFLVTEGQVVEQGQVIGLVGTTGWSTGCHLHFDVIVNDRYVDPAPYLGFPPSATASVPYAVVPHLVYDEGGRVVRTVEDGDVPIPDATETPSTPTVTPTTRPSTTPTTSRPTPTLTTTSPATRPSTTTSSPTTSSPTSSSPTSSSPTSSPTTSSPTTTTTEPPTPSTTTTDPPTSTTSAPPETTTEPVAPAPAESSEPTVTATTTATATATATKVLKRATEVATATQSATSDRTQAPVEKTSSERTSEPSSEPTGSSTAAAEGGA